MTVPAVHKSAAALYRATEGLGRWPYRGQVAAAGIGHSPTMRRWDGDPQTSIGAWSILAIRKAIEDAGVSPAEVDGLILSPDTSPGSFWPEGDPVPEDFLREFQHTGDLKDGLAQLSAEWLLKNMPELANVQFVMLAGTCMTQTLTAAIEAVGRGLAHTCIAVRGWSNFEGRYYQGGRNAAPTVAAPTKYGLSLYGAMSYSTAMQFQRYLYKYGKTHDMMAPFVVNSRDNGLLFPEGYWAQHRPTPLTAEDYLNSRWIAKPANLLDNDIPIHTAAAYLVTTAERARDLQQKPAYVLGHASNLAVDGDTVSPLKPNGVIETLEEAEERAASLGRKLYEAAGIAASDLSFENAYDGFSLFHAFHIEGLGFAGLKRGEALDLFQTDISIHGPHPVSPSGGNLGSGRTRYWMHTDSMQQIQGRAGARQIRIPAEVGVSGGPMTSFSSFIVWSSSPA
jgi:acetyl-CoA acetyltransferase